MPKHAGRRYWIIKHGLDSLRALPNYIWRTGEPDEPTSFKRVRKGDRWIAFAYAPSDARERALSQITGLYECVETSKYRSIPIRGREIGGTGKNAWMIRGRPDGAKLPGPVGVPPLTQLLGRNVYQAQTFTPITKDEYARIRSELRRRAMKPKLIPLLHREPRYEQEVLAVLACGHLSLGIQKILRIRNAFPDMTVKLRGRKEPVHLELEVYSQSFLGHGHHRKIDAKGRFAEMRDGKRDLKEVGLVCWVHNASQSKLKRHGITRVFELQTLIRERKRIHWARTL